MVTSIELLRKLYRRVNHRIRVGSYLVAFCTASLHPGCNAVDPNARPPSQPSTGPGGADYAHQRMTVEEGGDPGARYWMFCPDEPRPDEAPFVVFLHGWSGINPAFYGGWIQHLVRKGNIVVYPRYQPALLAPLEGLLPAAEAAVIDAWNRANTEGPVAPRPDRIFWMGHSLGGVFATILAGRSALLDLPPPAAVMAFEPGGEGFYPDDLNDVQRMPSATRVLLLVGEEDDVVGSSGASALASRMIHMPPENVEVVTVPSERRAVPPLVANHLAPLAIVDSFSADPDGGLQLRGLIRLRLDAIHKPDALDFFAHWKLADGLIDGSFRGQNLDYGFGDTDEQRFMGLLSDGTPVAPLRVRRPLAPLHDDSIRGR